jgi:hypothetical protein
VLSLTPASNAYHPGAGSFNQVLVHQDQPVSTPGAVPMVSAGNTLMTTEMGLESDPQEGEPDDVTGTCGVDPDELTLPSGVAARSIYPAAVVNEGSGALGLSGYRVLLPNDAGQTSDRLFYIATGTSIGAYPFGMVKFFLETSGDSFELDAQLIVPGQTTCTLELPGDLQVPLGDVNVRAQLYGILLTPSVVAIPLRDSWHVTLRY